MPLLKRDVLIRVFLLKRDALIRVVLLKRDALIRVFLLKRDGCMWPSPTKSVLSRFGGILRCV